MRTFFSIAVVLTCLGCSDEQTHFSSKEEFQAYLNDPDNGYIQTKEVGKLLVEARLIPSTEEGERGQVTIQMRLNEVDGKPVLELGGVSKDEAMAREGYLSFELTKDVYLEVDGQIVPCLFHHYERNYGLKPSVDVFFRFQNIEPKRDVVFVYTDKLFGQGMVRIKLNKELFTTHHVEA